MKEIKGKISLLFDRDRGITIEIIDKNSGTRIMNISVDPKDVCALLGRQVHMPCDIDYYDEHADKIGKFHSCKNFEFKIPSNLDYTARKVYAKARIKELCPSGWKPDFGFNSQNSFFRMDDGETWAREIIRSYTDKPPKKDKT